MLLLYNMCVFIIRLCDILYIYSHIYTSIYHLHTYHRPRARARCPRCCPPPTPSSRHVRPPNPTNGTNTSASAPNRKLTYMNYHTRHESQRSKTTTGAADPALLPGAAGQEQHAASGTFHSVYIICNPDAPTHTQSDVYILTYGPHRSNGPTSPYLYC
jgi:hypothetical protein